MSAPAQTIGTKLTANTGSWHAIARDEQRAIVDAAWTMPGPGWITRLGVWGRRSGGDPKAHLAVWDVNAAGEPGPLMGRTGRIPVSNNGASAEGPIVWTHPALGGAATAIRVEAGQVVRPGFRLDDGGVEFAVPTGSAEQTHHRRVVASGFPTDPFLPTSTLSAPSVGIWCLFVPDTAPSAPTNPSPVPDTAINTLTPILQATFVDEDSGAPIQDRIREYQIEARDAATLAPLWDGPAATFAASSSERSAARFSRVYAGTPLVGGQVVQFRERVADDHLAYADWSAWRTVTINALGQVDVSDSDPSGKIDSDPAAIVWGGRWHQPQGHATDRVRVRILQDGEVLKLGSEVVKAVASSALPGTAFTITAAQAGIGRLDPGLYAYQIGGRDAVSGQWSPWSGERAFTINAPPSTPVNLQPPSGAVSTTRPLLEWESADPDTDDLPGVDVVWDVEITPENGVPATFTTTAYDPDRGVASLQLTNTHFPTFKVYKWRTRGRDLSAGALGVSAWSPQQALTYAAGPVVTITSPAPGATVDTSTPTIAFTVSGGTMASFLVRLFREDEQRILHESPRIVSSQGLWTVPVGPLKNNHDYDLAVVARDTNNLDGASLRLPLRVAYTAPDALPNVNATPYRSADDPDPTSMLLTWPIGTYPPGEMAGYNIYRRAAGEPFFPVDPIRHISSVVQTRWIDHHAPGDGPQTWGITQLRRVGQETLESAPTEITAELDFQGIVIASVNDGGALRSVLSWEAHKSPASLGASLELPSDTVVTWGSNGLGIPVRRAGVAAETRSYGGLRLIDDDRGSADGHRDNLKRLVQRRDLVSVRSRREPRLWGQITSLDMQREGRGYSVDLEIAERFYAENDSGE